MRSKMTKSLTGEELHLNDFIQHLVISFVPPPLLFMELIQNILFNVINNYVSYITFCSF